MKADTAQPVEFETLERVFTMARLWRAWDAVARKKTGAVGCDGMTLEAFGCKADSRLEDLECRLVTGTYRPAPLSMFTMPKPGGGMREMGVACVRDRVAARCGADALAERFNTDFQPQSYAYRPVGPNAGAARVLVCPLSG
jgi:RNA-directed DNA polymerase